MDDNAPKPKKVMPAGMNSCDHFMQSPNYLFVTDVPAKDDKFNEANLYVSTDEGEQWTTSTFPKAEASKSNFFVIVDATEGEVLTAVSHTFTETRGDAQIDVTLGDGTSFSANATRAIFSEVITDNANNADSLNLITDPDNVLGCPENNNGLLKPVPSDNKGYAYVVQRGNCTFVSKLQMAYEAGARAVIVVNADDTHVVYMSVRASRVLSCVCQHWGVLPLGEGSIGSHTLLLKFTLLNGIATLATSPCHPLLRTLLEDTSRRAAAQSNQSNLLT
jgi:hypothetical protein